jgi:hypothetical protein
MAVRFAAVFGLELTQNWNPIGFALPDSILWHNALHVVFSPVTPHYL